MELGNIYTYLRNSKEDKVSFPLKKGGYWEAIDTEVYIGNLYIPMDGYEEVIINTLDKITLYQAKELVRVFTGLSKEEQLMICIVANYKKGMYMAEFLNAVYNTEVWKNGYNLIEDVDVDTLVGEFISERGINADEFDYFEIVAKLETEGYYFTPYGVYCD